MRHPPNPEWLSIVDVCWKCGSADLMERDDELGFEGTVVTVCDECEAIYDPVSGELLDEGAA